VGKAMLLIELGRAAEAEAAARQAIAINPASGAAWQVRSELKKFAAGDPDLAAMEAALSMARARAASSADRIDLEFALGKAWMDAGDAARAFAHFDEGNRHKRAKTPYDAAATSGCLNAVPTIFDDAFLRRLRGAGDPSEMPIFVIGMPRSGTSLIEQILASHSQVHGAGESAAIGQIAASLAGAATGAAYPEGLRGLQPENLMRMGREYVARVAPLAQGKRHVVDKMPTNFQYAGLIHLMLPNARIVHCRRNPVDTCLSCYTRNLRGRLGLCFDQRELGALYRDYERLMAHWRAVLPPERFIEVEYEEVVADLEGQARRLLEFCGLTWEPACLSFHATERRVQTASMNQVRQPAYRSSIGRWRAYAAHLGPLLEALGMAPEQRQRQAIAQA
jgi:tetratricopeptide (TPR) repeat protein